MLEVVAVVSAATAKGVKASLGGTCKGPPIRTNYPKGELARGGLTKCDPLICIRAEWRLRTVLEYWELLASSNR